MKKLWIAVVVACLCATPSAFAANSLAVTAGAAVDGNYGLEYTFDGSTNAFYVMDTTPLAETTYNMSFWLEEGTLNITNCGAFCSTQFMFMASQDASNGYTVMRIIAGRMVTDDATGERHLYRFSVRNDFGNFLYVGGIILNGSVIRKHITLEWQQGTPGNSDGVARIYSSNDGGTPNLQGEVYYQNSMYDVDQTMFGGVAGLGDQATDALTNGTLHFDSFVSWR